MPKNINLPKTPTVVAKKETVVILFSNGNEMMWGTEKNEELAVKMAKELEVELRAVKYVQWHVHNFIRDMREYLGSLDIDEGLLDSILKDGHAYARDNLSKGTVDSIIMGAERGLRKLVIENLGSEKYII